MTLLAQSLSPREVAVRVRAAVGSVYRWQQAWRTGGKAALAAKPVLGAPRKVSDQPCQQLLALLLQGARAYGFPNELWTLQRIAAVIRTEFGISYHPAHVWKILRRLNWSCQVPKRQSLQRDELAIAHGKRYKWPLIKKSPALGRRPRLPG